MKADPWIELIEPAAQPGINARRTESLAISQAISLKRIADAMDGGETPGPEDHSAIWVTSAELETLRFALRLLIDDHNGSYAEDEPGHDRRKVAQEMLAALPAPAP